MCAAKTHVRFAPKSDRESGFPHKAMSALHPKADMCSARTYVRFGPKADITVTTSAKYVSAVYLPRSGEAEK